MLLLKTKDQLEASGWKYLAPMKYFEHHDKTLPNGSAVVLSDRMIEIFESLNDIENKMLYNSLTTLETCLFKYYWWTRDMFNPQTLPCLHQWVNVSFFEYGEGVFYVCKLCDLDRSEVEDM